MWLVTNFHHRTLVLPSSIATGSNQVKIALTDERLLNPVRPAYLRKASCRPPSTVITWPVVLLNR